MIYDTCKDGDINHYRVVYVTKKFQINLNVQNGSDLKNYSMFYPCFRVEL